MPRSLATRPEQRQGANEVGGAVSRHQPAEKTAKPQGCNRAATCKAGRPLSFCVRVAWRPRRPPRRRNRSSALSELRAKPRPLRWKRHAPGGACLIFAWNIFFAFPWATSRPPLPRRWQLMIPSARWGKGHRRRDCGCWLAGPVGQLPQIVCRASPANDQSLERPQQLWCTSTCLPKTVHWGYWDSSLAPILTVRSGDRVTIDTLSGEPADLPEPTSGFSVLPDHREVLSAGRGGPGPHLLTGPIAVADARAGDVLEVHIREVMLRQDWGWNLQLPLHGTLPEDFPMRVSSMCQSMPTTSARACRGVRSSSCNRSSATSGLRRPRRRGGGCRPGNPAPSAATWTIRSLVAAPPYISLCLSTEPCSRRAMVTPCWGWGSVSHRHRGRAERDVRAHRPQGPQALPSPRRDGRDVDHHGFDEDLDDAVKIALRDMIKLRVRSAVCARKTPIHCVRSPPISRYPDRRWQ